MLPADSCVFSPCILMCHLLFSIKLPPYYNKVRRPNIENGENASDQLIFTHICRIWVTLICELFITVRANLIHLAKVIFFFFFFLENLTLQDHMACLCLPCSYVTREITGTSSDADSNTIQCNWFYCITIHTYVIAKFTSESTVCCWQQGQTNVLNGRMTVLP